MPTFDRWDLLGEGQESRQENPRRLRIAVESEEDTAGTEGSAQRTKMRARGSKKRPSSTASETTETDSDRTELAETPPAAHSPSVRPGDDGEAQSSSHAPKKARLVEEGGDSAAPVAAGSPAVVVPRQERSARKWGHIGR